MARSAIALGLWLSLPACNAVLGMERAHLGEVDAAPTGAGGRASVAGGAGGAVRRNSTDTLPDCTTTSDACMQCLDDKCSGAATTCLANADCRADVETHANCLANNLCEDRDCATTIESNETSLALCLPKCSDTCSSGEGLMPMCALYCACMQSKCTGQFPDLGGSFDACVQKCNSDSTIKSNALCRVVHCELAAKPSDVHCRHAVGDPTFGLCTAPIPKCLVAGKKNTGLGPCSTDGDCCSGKCQQDINICTTPH